MASKKSKRRTSNRSKSQVANEVQAQARKVRRGYQKAAITSLDTGDRSMSDLNNGRREINEEMTATSKQSFEDVLQAWQSLLDARPLARLVEVQTKYLQDTMEAYASGVTRLSELYLGIAQRGPADGAKKKQSGAT